ncbi:MULTISPECIES: MerR family transcriptional regulator [unclassified Sporosarcina]|uniref:MerR family transcriptional regulator n=1 Tax=unclassified Sporosarcina TaxID=2647733 RepID=UPI00203F0459|nr:MULTISPECIES: MerR family transcriptional regulator [unclassified Sporosarcina]GKV65407.1 MerR family transcriptional regulator [Sporosarcina sp. NCCP-2331]GLB55531.1 MerR family transcriptional regulator [Sporosarcina sp. NCCP-2378]
MKVKEVAELTGISIRTLHHYNDIGLLIPDEVTEAGYRLYSNGNLADLQQILFFQELGFSLKRIKELLESPSFERLEALELQRKMLLQKKVQLEVMLRTIDRTIQSEKGEDTMTNEEKFKGFDFRKNPYGEEAKARWGEKEVEQTSRKFGEDVQDEMNRIYFKLAEIRHGKADSNEAQAVIEEWFELLNRMGSYSLDAFKGLGEMYVADERFKQNIDQFGEGLAVFMRDAMSVYSDRQKRG